MKTVVTHSGGFHADDVFAVATLELALGELKVVRTRDEELIKNADIVLDVGRIYDEEKFRFDHHQEGGAGVRQNGISYASFGLVWKSFGEKVCGSKEIADRVDMELVSVVDAHDNGIELTKPIHPLIFDLNVSAIIASMNPTFIENESPDDIFPNAVELAKQIIKRQIVNFKTNIEAGKIFREAYEFSKDKRLVVLDTELNKNSWQDSAADLPGLLFVAVPYGQMWALRAVRKNLFSFENRKDLPSTWAGKGDREFEEITGIKGAVFCHNKLFVATAKDKDAILKLAELALNF